MMLSIILLLSPMVSSNSISHFKQAFLSNPSLRAAGSEDFIEQTRAQAELLKEHLWSIASNPAGTEIINKVFAEKNTACINSMEDAIEAVEAGTKLVQKAGAELRQLVQVFNTTVAPAVAVKESATIIRLLDVLLPKITPAAQSYCGDADQFASFSGLVVLLDELASKDDLYFSLHTTQNLKSSVNIVSHVINFLKQLKTSFSKLDRLCTMDKDYNIEAIHTIASMMTDLADLYTRLGGLTAAAEISKNQNFIKKAVVSLIYNFLSLTSLNFPAFFQGNIEKLGDLGLISLDCNTPWTLELIAGTMDDLAVLMEDVGLDSLCKELNLECVF